MTQDNKIKRIARIVTVGAYSGIVLAAAGVAWAWSRPDILAEQIGIAGRPLALTGQAMAGGILASLVPLLLTAYALWQVAHLFTAFGRGLVFEESNAAILKRIGWTLLALAVVTPLVRALQTVILTLDNPPGQRILAVGFDLGTLATLLAGGAVLGFAAIMREAARLADENRSFV